MQLLAPESWWTRLKRSVQSKLSCRSFGIKLEVLDVRKLQKYLYRQARNVWAVSYMYRASARNYGLRLGSFVGLKKRSDGETWYLYSAIHRRFGLLGFRLRHARSMFVWGPIEVPTYVFCVFCTFRVFRPTYPFFKNTLLLERVHIRRGTGGRRTTLSSLSQLGSISGLEALFRLARSRAPCACASYVDTLLLVVVTIGRMGR